LQNEKKEKGKKRMGGGGVEGPQSALKNRGKKAKRKWCLKRLHNKEGEGKEEEHNENR